MFLQLLAQNPLRYIQIIVILIISITLHELAHGIAAINQGDDTPSRSGHMTLNPLVHMGWVSIAFLCISGMAWGAMPVNSAKFRNPMWGDIWVSAAGPLSNLGLGFVAIMLLAIANQTPFLSVEFFYVMAKINLVLFLFNLLPIPPLDGFHIFSELFPQLKALNKTSFGLFAMTLFFVVPGVGVGLYTLAELIIHTMVGARIA